jgi:hypothetical protein
LTNTTAERLANEQLQATLAASRVQKGHDLTKKGRRIQVKYLANPSGTWRNEHPIMFSPDVDDYVLVIFEDLRLRAMLKFTREGLEQVCMALKKRHPNQRTTLQLTRANVVALLRDQDRFAEFGVTCFTFPAQDIPRSVQKRRTVE